LRKSVLEDLRGFDEGSKVPDTEFILRARSQGYHVHFSAKAVVLHDPDRSRLSTVLRYSSEHAAETIRLRIKYRELLKTPILLRSAGLILLCAPFISFWVTSRIYVENPGLARYCWTAPLVYLQKLAWCWGAVRGTLGRAEKERPV
jgi:GT2 family glycosyltransferase